MARLTCSLSLGCLEFTLPDLLDQHEQLMTVRLEAVRAMIKELKALYMALSDSQKRTADQLFWGPVAASRATPERAPSVNQIKG